MPTQHRSFLYLAALLTVFVGLASAVYFSAGQEAVEDIVDEVSRMRERIYEKIDVSANRASNLLELPWNMDSSQILRKFERDEGGVFCAGAAQTLATFLHEKGYEAYILSYGFLETFTHAVVLVRIGGKLYLQDPYLNYRYDEDYFEILANLTAGHLPLPVQSVGRHRDVHVSSLNYSGWAVDLSFPAGEECKKIADDHYVCRAEHTLVGFVSRYRRPVYGEAVAVAAKFDLPADGRSLLMFPYGISGPDGYVNDPNSHLNNSVFGEIVNHIRQVSNGRIDPMSFDANFPQ